MRAGLSSALGGGSVEEEGWQEVRRRRIKMNSKGIFILRI
jgi:hypothetical protein